MLDLFTMPVNEPAFDVHSNCSLRAVSNLSCNGLMAKTDYVHLCALILDIFI